MFEWTFSLNCLSTYIIITTVLIQLDVFQFLSLLVAANKTSCEKDTIVKKLSRNLKMPDTLQLL